MPKHLFKISVSIRQKFLSDGVFLEVEISYLQFRNIASF